MASRTPSRGRSGGRSTQSSSSSQPLIFGGIGLVVVVALVVMMNRKGADAGTTPGANTPAAAKPAAAAPLAAAKTGKNPTRPAPTLTAEMLEQVRSSRKVAEGLYNEGVTARTAGDNATARDKQTQAKAALEKLESMLEAPLRWQEEAQLGGWAQPAEYVSLEKEYGAVMNLTNRIRKGGGT
ncbi:MAG TPA: hypothetical protein VFZ65_03740 [Planctomycetota bacterium]|nr:hypothetical protein [Planctomycetota bacterium]